ncbi:hypothetical protein CCAX7_54670 [Capsulimonas corticalis]|uniref:Uncharacterized protein n=1 Tax=Capsulimonas corticalis TaxID=2219043 RepID=A0A402D5W4_9BACT|nr:hypothetical protein [Capsulimonas corticalis]BDI33416.1 hypothetical protein CCAX7_54670 [Capsulimonas corticalis]
MDDQTTTASKEPKDFNSDGPVQENITTQAVAKRALEVMKWAGCACGWYDHTAEGGPTVEKMESDLLFLEAVADGDDEKTIHKKIVALRAKQLGDDFKVLLYKAELPTSYDR